MRHKCDGEGEGEQDRWCWWTEAVVGVGGMIQHNVALLLKQLVIRRYAEPPYSICI